MKFLNKIFGRDTESKDKFGKISELLEHDSDLAKFKDEDGQSFLHFATEYQYLEVIKFIEKEDEYFSESAKDSEQQLKLVEILLTYNNKIDIKDNWGQTPLYLAVENNLIKIVKLLIDKGADININAKEYGLTPLHRAAERNHAEIIKILLDNGANIDVKDKNGITPLYYAVDRSNEKSVRMLLDYGANILIKNKNGLTPLQCAQIHSNTNILNMVKSRLNN